MLLNYEEFLKNKEINENIKNNLLLGLTMMNSIIPSNIININNYKDLINIINKSNLDDYIKNKIMNDLIKVENDQLIINNLKNYEKIIKDHNLTINNNKDKILRNYFFPKYKEGEDIYNHAIKEIIDSNSIVNKKINGLIELGYKAKNQQDSLLTKLENDKYTNIDFNDLYNLILTYNILKLNDSLLIKIDNITNILIQSQSSYQSLGGNNMNIIKIFDGKLNNYRIYTNYKIKLYNNKNDNEGIMNMFLYYIKLKNKEYDKINIKNILLYLNSKIKNNFYSKLIN